MICRCDDMLGLSFHIQHCVADITTDQPLCSVSERHTYQIHVRWRQILFMCAFNVYFLLLCPETCRNSLRAVTLFSLRIKISVWLESVFSLYCRLNILQTFSSPLQSHQLHSLLVLQGIMSVCVWAEPPLSPLGDVVGCCSMTDRCQGIGRANQHLLSLATRTVLQ